MSFRKRVALLVLTHLCILFVFLWCSSSDTLVPRIVVTAMVLIVVSQPSLWAIWVAFGGRPSPWRLVGAVFFLTCGLFLFHVAAANYDALLDWAYGFAILFQFEKFPPYAPLGYGVLDSDTTHFIAATFLCCLPASTLGLLGLRSLGMEVGRVDSESTPMPAGPRIQFSLSSMLQWVAAVAVLLGLGSYVFRWPGMEDVLPDWQTSLAMAAGVAILTLLVCLSLWLALAERHWRVRVPIIIACPLIALATAYTEVRPGPPPSVPLLIAGVLCGITTSMLLSLLLLRGGGLRVRWRRSKEAAPVAETEAPSDFDPFEDSVRP